MPKKNPKPRQPKPSLITKTITNLQKLSSLQKLIAMLCIAIAILFLWHQADIYREKQMYNEAEAQIASFVDKAAKLASSSKKTYAACGYGSEKFSKGPLSCTVGAVLTYRAAEEASIINTVEQAKSLEKNLGWSNMLDTTAGSQEYTSKNYIRTSVYDKGDLSCSVDYRYKENDRGEKITIHNKSILLVEVGCTGLALKEHF